FLLMISGCGLGAFIAVAPDALPQAEAGAGGILGNLITLQGLVKVFGDIGTKLLLLAVFFASVTLFTGLSWFTVMDFIGRYTLAFFDWLLRRFYLAAEWWRGRRAARQAKTQRIEALT